MRYRSLVRFVVIIAVLFPAIGIAAKSQSSEKLRAEQSKIAEQFRAAEQRARDDFNEAMRKARDKALRDLETLEEKAMGLKDLDAAVAVRAQLDEIRSLTFGESSERAGDTQKAEEPTDASPAIITRVSLDIPRSISDMIVVAFFAKDGKGKEYEHSRGSFKKSYDIAGPKNADALRQLIRDALPESCRFDRRVTINVTQPWHPADHSNRNRCSWNCQLEGKGPGEIDKVCTSGET